MKKAQLAELLGATGGIIADTFRRMEMAEEIIERHFPRAGRKPSSQSSLAFKVACPPVCLRDKGDDLYRAHLEELCQRIKKHKLLLEAPWPVGSAQWVSINEATDAELLALFSETSFKAPLRHSAALIMDNLFVSCFPEKAKQIGIEKHDLEQVAREELADARRKLSRTINRLI